MTFFLQISDSGDEVKTESNTLPSKPTENDTSSDKVSEVRLIIYFRYSSYWENMSSNSSIKSFAISKTKYRSHEKTYLIKK